MRSYWDGLFTMHDDGLCAMQTTCSHVVLACMRYGVRAHKRRGRTFVWSGIERTLLHGAHLLGQQVHQAHGQGWAFFGDHGQRCGALARRQVRMLGAAWRRWRQPLAGERRLQRVGALQQHAHFGGVLECGHELMIGGRENGR